MNASIQRESMNQHDIVKYAWMNQEWMRIDDT